MGDPTTLLQNHRGVRNKGKSVRPLAASAVCHMAPMYNQVEVTVEHWTGWKEQVQDKRGMPYLASRCEYAVIKKGSPKDMGILQHMSTEATWAKHLMGEVPFAVFSLFALFLYILEFECRLLPHWSEQGVWWEPSLSEGGLTASSPPTSALAIVSKKLPGPLTLAWWERLETACGLATWLVGCGVVAGPCVGSCGKDCLDRSPWWVCHQGFCCQGWRKRMWIMGLGRRLCRSINLETSVKAPPQKPDMHYPLYVFKILF